MSQTEVSPAVPAHSVVEPSAVRPMAPGPIAPPTQSAGDAAVGLFADLALRAEVQQAVVEAGYPSPTPIQAQIIPHVLAGRDVLAQSQTGSGKTAAFALPILSCVDLQRRDKPQVLVLAPTRELAMQVSQSFQQYGRYLGGLNLATIYGGQDYEVQFRQLHRRPQIVVGTPGRVIDHVNRGSLDLSEIRILVLDEADEMLNMGFLEDVQFVLEKMPEQRQITLFSATLPDAIREIAQRSLRDPVKITIKQKTMTAESIQQRAVFVANDDKLEVLARFLEVESTDGVIVFTKTKEATITVAESLVQQGFKATALNGDMPQKVRERAIHQLRSGQLDIVVATDVAARGLDVPRISHVFNFDLPHDSESYIHRIGRTGRAGRHGQAIVFLTGGQRNKLRLIERATKQPIEVIERPSAKQINQQRLQKFKAQIRSVVAEQDLTLFQNMVEQLVAEQPELEIAQVAAALAILSQNGRPFFIQDRPQGRHPRDAKFERRETRDGRGRGEKLERATFDGPPRGRSVAERGRPARPETSGKPTSRSGPPAAGMQRYRVEMGWHDGLKPGSLVGAIANEAGLEGREIGTINIQDRHAFVDLPNSIPLDVIESLGSTKIRGKALRLAAMVGTGGTAPRKRAIGKFSGRGKSRDKR